MKHLLIAAALTLSALTAGAQTQSTQRDSVAETTPFRNKVKMATHIAAGNILADPGSPARVRQFAQIVITDPAGIQWLAAVTYGVLTNAAINAGSTDSDILFTVNSIFSKYAYAYYREVPQ